jgi:hypothetical protein
MVYRLRHLAAFCLFLTHIPTHHILFRYLSVTTPLMHIQLASPQPQKSFSASTLGNSTYASSPLSTPSRTLAYSLSPASPPFDTSIRSIDSSLSFSVPPSPSPIVGLGGGVPLGASIRARGTPSGRTLRQLFVCSQDADLDSTGPLDASFLRRLERDAPELDLEEDA